MLIAQTTLQLNVHCWKAHKKQCRTLYEKREAGIFCYISHTAVQVTTGSPSLNKSQNKMES